MSKFDEVKQRLGLFEKRIADAKRSRDERIELGSVDLARVQQQIEKIDAELTDLIQQNYETASKHGTVNESVLDSISAISARRNVLADLSSNLRHDTRTSANVKFQKSIQAQFTPRHFRESVAQISRESTTLGPALEQARSLSTVELEDRLSRSRTLLSRQEGRIMDTVQQIDKPGGIDRLQTQARTYDKLVEDVAQIETAIGTQKKLGLHSTGRYFSAQKFTDRVAKEREEEEISRGVAEGKYGKREDVETKLAETGQKVIDVFRDLDAATVELSRVNRDDVEARQAAIDKVKQLNEEHDRLRSDYKEFSNALREMRRQGIGGGDGGWVETAGRRMQQAGAVLGGAAQFGQAMTDAYSYGTIGSELAQTDIRIGMVGTANRRYDDFIAAGRGDVSARSRLLDQLYEEQGKESKEMSERAEDVSMLETIFGVGQAGGGFLSKLGSSFVKKAPSRALVGASAAAVGGPTSLGGAAIGLGVAGVEAAVESAPAAYQAFKKGVAYSKDIPAAQTELSRYNQIEELRGALSYQSNRNIQTTEDQFRSMAEVARGFGVGTVSAAPIQERRAGGLQRYLPYGKGDLGRVLEGERGSETARQEQIDKFIEEQQQAMSAGMTPSGGLMDTGSRRGRPGKRRFKLTGKFATPETDEAAEVAQPTEGVSRSEAVMRAFTTPEAVKELARYGIDPEKRDTQRVIAGFREGLGATFVDQGTRGMQQDVIRAKRAASFGLVDREEQYIGMRSQMSAIGATSMNELRDVLEVGVRAGLDSSKFSTTFVSQIQSLAQSVSVSSGISTAAGTAAALGGGTAALREAGVSKELSQIGGFQAAQLVDQFTSSKDLDIFNLMQTSEIARLGFGGPDDPRGIGATQRMTLSQTQTLQKLREQISAGKEEGATEEEKAAGEKAQKDFDTFVNLKGLRSEFEGKSDEEIDEKVKGLLVTKQKTSIARSAGGLPSEDMQAISNAIEKGMTHAEFAAAYPETEQRFSRAVAERYPDKTGAALWGSTVGQKGQENVGQLPKVFEELAEDKTGAGTKGKGGVPPGTSSPGGLLGQDLKFDISGAMTAAKQFEEGARVIAEAVGGFKNIAAASEIIANAFDPKKLQEAAVASAKGMEIPMNQLKVSVADFTTATQNMTTEIKAQIDRLQKMQPMLKPR